MNLLSQVVYKSRYARFLEEEGRREHWPETVKRYMDFIATKVKLSKSEYKELYDSIFNLEVLPSMRLLMAAGAPADRDNICAYNCAYTPIDSKRSFAEVLYILLNGTGVGFSVERQYINQLPIVPKLERSTDVLVVQDSKLGWAKAYNKFINSLYEGDIPCIDYSKVRHAGARLKTFGGRASGPDPLRRLFTITEETFRQSEGRKLNSLEVHDIVCTIGEVVVVGGVRRSALISLSNLTDRRMREAKVGAWWEQNKQRSLANNSVAYTEKPDAETFMEEWLSLIKSKSGERGIFNRVAAQHQASRFGRRDGNMDYGCNPCSEIILRPRQFCNLTETVIRPSDNFDDIQRKVRVATILGTIQATLTDFGFISEEWKKNCEEERLLGVSLTGIYDHPILSGRDIKDAEKTHAFGVHEDSSLGQVLEKLREHAVNVNKEWAKRLGINPSAAITCVKPSGTVSQLVDSSSGIHPRFSAYYIRNIRMDKKDPLTDFLIKHGVPNEPDVSYPDSQVVFSFPCKAPDGSVVTEQTGALDHLELWKTYHRHWTEHKPSVTVQVQDNKWVQVAAWVFENFDQVSGVAFLPRTSHSYKQAPYISITEEEYRERERAMPTELPWGELQESEDNVQVEPACEAATCAWN